ncbi:MAG: hypothetical protein INF41_06375 [Rhodospirillaceae bacterium]|jgi:hypothetical protein|nr:hypothetical protein [Rhodospirillaceae bacterium]
MIIAEFFETFDLHDSGVEFFDYSPQEQTILFKVELADNRINPEEENSPENPSGDLIFWGVTNFSSTPDIMQAVWSETIASGILDVTVSPLSDDANEAVEIALEYEDCLKQGSFDVYVLNFTASHVEWVPAEDF